MAATDTAALRILVVEDDPDAAEALTDLLDMLGHTPATARDGGKALELAPGFAPQLVLCDLTLPGLDGFAVARALRANPAMANTRLVALSGHSVFDVRDEVRSAGFDQLLPKPVQLDALTRIIADAAR